MSWLEKPPAKGPKAPQHVDMMKLHRIATAAPGQLPPDVAKLIEIAPALQFDRWGNPLPLPPSDQHRLDRIAAIVGDPYARGRALLLSGELAPDEVDALATVRPVVYDILVQEATREMLEGEPPFQPWAEDVLDRLFRKPAPAVYEAAEEQKQPQPGSGKQQVPSTPAERREIAIRERR
jgi:hypothetical protein